MTMVADGHGEALPELIRRRQLSSCRHDRVPSFVAVVTSSAASGVVVHEVLADSGYAHKVPAVAAEAHHRTRAPTPIPNRRRRFS